MAVLRFWAPLGGGLGAMYDVYLGPIGKLVVDFLLVLIKRILLSVTGEPLRTNIEWKSALSLQEGQICRKFQVDEVTPTNRSSFKN